MSKSRKAAPAPTAAQLLQAVTDTKAAFEAALAAYHKMPCSMTENDRRTAYMAQDKAYNAARAAGLVQ